MSKNNNDSKRCLMVITLIKMSTLQGLMAFKAVRALWPFPVLVEHYNLTQSGMKEDFKAYISQIWLHTPNGDSSQLSLNKPQ
jgi:hypothetical protein